MKILFVLGQISYPLRVGQLVHTVDLLKYMSRHYDCYVIGFSANNNPNTHQDELIINSEIPELKYLKIYKKNSGIKLIILKLFNLIKLKPLGFSNWDNVNFTNEINKLVGQHDFDLIHLIWFPAVGQYLNLFKKYKTILSLQDSQSLLLRNEYSSKNLSFFRKLFLYISAKLYLNSEKLIYRHASIVHTVSQNDKNYIDNWIKSGNVVYIPTHIPSDCITPPSISNVKYKKDFILLRPNGVGIEWFFDSAWKAIKVLQPGIALTVIAQSLPSNILNQIQSDPQIQYKAWVKSLWEEILEHEVVLLADMSGSGLSTRAICAMSLGVPIVGTPLSFRGMDVSNGITCLIASEENDYASKAAKLYNDRHLRQSIAINAKKYSDNNYGYDQVMSATKKLYLDLMSDV